MDALEAGIDISIASMISDAVRECLEILSLSISLNTLICLIDLYDEVVG
ncbi:MAG TPA: hypothetical protein PKU94_06045 [Candidatus Hydrothermia bacterium]|nr:hypothetical protein [Candidatus Hydrothermia bacterium]